MKFLVVDPFINTSVSEEFPTVDAAVTAAQKIIKDDPTEHSNDRIYVTKVVAVIYPDRVVYSGSQ